MTLTLRTKTLLIVGLTILALFGVLFGVLRSVVNNGFSTVEDDIARTNVERARAAILDDINKVNTTLGDWAAWDETYTFASDRNTDYIDSNLSEVTFTNLSINMMVFVDVNGEVVYGQGIDLASGEFEALQESLESEIANNDFLLTHPDTNSHFEGFILLPENPLMVAAQPISKDGREGPINGTLLMGRFLDTAQIDKLEERTKFVITIKRLDGEALPDDFQVALDVLSQSDEDIHIDELSSERIAGYLVKNDVYGDPGLIIRVDFPRDVFAEGQDTLGLLIISLAGVGVVFILLTLVIIERLVLARLLRLSDGVAEIGASGNLSGRLSLPGSDELSQLAAAINKMLTDLQASLAREKELKAEVQRLRIEIDQTKKQKSVKEIVETDYFQDLQAKARALRAEKPKKGGKSKDK